MSELTIMEKCMQNQLMITQFPDETKRREACEKGWLNKKTVKDEECEDMFEITGTVYNEVENGEKVLVLRDGEVHGIKKCIAESINPLQTEIEQLKKRVSDIVAVVAVVTDKVAAKETLNNLKMSTIDVRNLHIKDFIKPKLEGDVDES